ncbi:trypsin-like peptidase domain-containing protein [Kitasatospora sp. NPDC101176]|uniref:trypsin-like peptidase domain-containing protein n=1 Tax=Kitasatospora sp. NPDC101176 TaxID=3364099 RepID=UPI0037F6FCF5
MTASAARAAVEVWDGPSFLGSGFLVAPGTVLTAAHVARRAVNEPLVRGRWGSVTVADPARLFPADPGAGRFHAFPDLALVTLRVPVAPPELVLDAGTPPPGTPVLVAGFSPHTPAAGVHDDSLLLTVAGPAAGFVRATGDEVRDGFSGGMVVRLDTGAVCGVLKGSRDFEGVRGGWFTPLSALADVLAADDPLRARLTAAVAPAATAAPPVALPTVRRLLPVLLRVPGTDDPDFRRTVVRAANETLADPLTVAYRAVATDHLLELAQTCLGHRDPWAALAAVADALDLLRPGSAAVRELRALAGLPEDGP